MLLRTRWLSGSVFRALNIQLAAPSKATCVISKTSLLCSKRTTYLNRAFRVSSPQHGPNTVVRVPSMAESITEGTLAQFNKQVGDFIAEDEELATIETDKIDVSVNAPHAGLIQKLLVAEGDTVTVDQAVAELEATQKSVEDERKQEDTQETPSTTYELSEQSEKEFRESEQPATVQPVHPRKPTMQTKQTSESRPEGSIVAETPQRPSMGGGRMNRREKRVKMTPIRQKTAQHLKESQNTAAFLTTFNEVDMSNLIEFRKKNRDAVLERHCVKLGFMGAIARASVLALKELPVVNASIENEDTIVYRDYVDISVAAAIPKGLVTPVLRNVESMSIVEIEKGIAGLVARAREGRLTIDDLTGGSFTISNSGIWGSLFGTPIINMPQTAVLGTYGIQERPVAVNGQVEIRPIMYLALTYDHRIIDGREGTTFLVRVKNYLENPESMLLG